MKKKDYAKYKNLSEVTTFRKTMLTFRPIEIIEAISKFLERDFYDSISFTNDNLSQSISVVVISREWFSLFIKRILMDVYGRCMIMAYAYETNYSFNIDFELSPDVVFSDEQIAELSTIAKDAGGYLSVNGTVLTLSFLTKPTDSLLLFSFSINRLPTMHAMVFYNDAEHIYSDE